MIPMYKPRDNSYREAFAWIILACAVILVIVHFIRNSQPVFDYPEEFNVHTISSDRAHPTEMMVVYDTLDNKYIFEFMDK